MRSFRRWTIAAVLGLGLTVGRPRPAQADGLDDIGTFIGTVLITACALAIADTTFATYDLVVAGKGELPSRGWAVAETVVTVPQTLLFNGLFFGAGASDDDLEGALAPLAIPVVGVTALTTHGIWANASTTVNPSALAGISTAIGANTTFTGYDITRAINGKFGTRSMGIAQIFFTVPQTVVGSVQIANGTKDRPAWIGLTAWSGTLVLHGLISAIVGGRRSEPLPAVEAPPAIEPAPPPPEPPGDRNKPPLMVPASIHFGPTMVTDGVARAPGLGIVGVF